MMRNTDRKSALDEQIAGEPLAAAFGLVHSYAQLPVIEDLSLEVGPGESVAIVAPSGAGKSSLLRLILELESPTQGQTYLGLKPSEIGAAFQEDNLLPWLRLRDNVSLLCQLHNRPAQGTELTDVLREYGLNRFESYFPFQLSVGMKQKAAICRLLLLRPRLYVLDETMANIDDLTRFKICDVLYTRVLKEQCSLLFVSHNLTDVLHVADRILVGSERPLRILNVFTNPLPRTRDYLIRFTEAFRAAVEELRACAGQR